MSQVDEIDDAAIRRAFGARVRELREHAGLTQEELAAGLGKSRERVQKIEHGRNAAPLPELVRIAAYFEITVADLLDLADQPSRDTEHRRALRDHIKTLRPADPDTIRRLTKIARVLRAS
ncbi:DNA-binding transcriptional regulator, XRE-family HTH domain [Limimonas halophila]|uniref:DNA-binding transcriptional regulator, XRE-family HTH domain n=1 Tax=Limimonas halophila TaxID=1082479 RepID=A0A1G7SSN4_9PROT|nr:helix-turn-helix transcriptional regulator [Limimonas halophila]SDG25290.1 DNA-binding transcriptional regulator, XRE-family HTH domain [Limimonas halophila]